MKLAATAVAVAGIPLAVVARLKLSDGVRRDRRLGAHQAGRAGVGDADRGDRHEDRAGATDAGVVAVDVNVDVHGAGVVVDLDLAAGADSDRHAVGDDSLRRPRS